MEGGQGQAGVPPEPLQGVRPQEQEADSQPQGGQQGEGEILGIMGKENEEEEKGKDRKDNHK